ncbi:het-s domain protein [Colletotrichum truncatum]|uniref:Het-s domain protein n=1 Tax=Colletotrichum truncatum TaxID=5467 RepID=A0ACC3YKE6_COLTU|nr:het-s domain protein [Colletotrichum truncatum]KAF6784393.1 het-s domain protein [Colletotrichum truncatum]
MEGVGFSGGFQLPIQRRLSRLYNDTKKSSDFVKEPIRHSEDPEIKSLHRKLRIQKDRFMSWGLEWSDPNQSAEIDTSLSKAGVSEIVGSILSTIKDTLAELDALWKAYEKQNGGGGVSEKSKGDLKTPFVTWDKARFADYTADLTQSVDTLYDLSRTRASAAMTSGSRSRLQRPLAAIEESKAFESTRMQTPQQIDPSTLTNIRSMQAEPMTESRANLPPRDIVFMSKQAWADLAQHIGRQPFAPLLLEFAAFDSIYSITGIMPPMARFEKLSSGLQQESQRAPGAWIGLPRLLGYFEDLENSRLGLVYHFPPTFNAVSFENFTQNPLYNLCTLGDLLSRPDFEPTLEAKFRLAHNLTNTVFDLHARGITHGSLVDKNVSFCNMATPDLTTGVGEVDVRRPMISSFDLFPDAPPDQEPASPSLPLFRHPLDPRTTPASPINDKTDSRILDLYSLAMILLSVGLWTKLENLVPDPSQPISENVLEQLAIRCGTLYMKAVQTCWNAVDQELQGKVTGEDLLSNVQVKTSRYLEACCILDGVSALDDRLSLDLGERTISPAAESPRQSISGPSKDTKTASNPPVDTRRPSYDIKVPIPDPSPARSYPSAEEEKRQLAKRDADEAAAAKPAELPAESKPAKPQSPKTRLYPQIPLPADAIEKWNTIVMPQVNQALRHFYRKHSEESVEISLESIGSSPQKTQPTVLVVCTSVSKVKSILTRKLGQLFDGKSGFGLKVCKGQVLRSRKEPGEVKRSAAHDEDDEDEVKAANPDFQERPTNGASIGAWVGDRHLPPVSLGGLVVVDDKPYGMTVHHMLDDPVEIAKHAKEQDITHRSMAQPTDDIRFDWYAESSAESSNGEDFACEFSDSESEAYSDTDITSEDSEEEESDEEGEYDQPGDIPGVEPGCGDGYIITQPAMDDVEEDFYPSEETANEDHLDSFTLGEVYASSGLRRREQNGLIHEIDWALFEFHDERLPDENSIPRIRTRPSSLLTGKRPSHEAMDLHPTTVAPTSALPGMEVQCMARTSGLQTGLILPALTSVKISGRITPSHTYQVSSAAAETPAELSRGGRKLAMGIPGDSGAWVVERAHGRVCGHVLAWSGRKRVAYICPMDVLLLDIAETLEARTVGLPGGEAVVKIRDPNEQEEDEDDYGGDTEEPSSSPFLDPRDDDDLNEVLEEGDDDAPVLVQAPESSRQGDKQGEGQQKKQHGQEKYASDDSHELSRRMESMGIGRSRVGIGMCS